MADLEIRSELPPSMHPKIIGPESKEMETGRGRLALAAGEAALTVMYEAAAAIADTAAAIALAPKTGPVMVRGKTIQASSAADGFADASDKAFARAAKRVDAQMALLLGFEADLGKQVKEAVDSPGSDRLQEISIFTEIRQYFRALPDAKQLMTALAAVRADDRRTVTALLSGPSYLSGLTPENLGLIRDAAGLHFARQEFTQLRQTRKIAAKVRAAGALFLEFHGRVKETTVESSAPKVKARSAIRALQTA